MADQNQEGAPSLDPSDPLDRIAIEASGDEAAAQQAQDDFLNPPPEHDIDPAQAWAQIPFMLGGLLAMAMPELEPVYNEQACHKWGVGMAAVADKYGWDAGETMSRWAPEIALTVASIPLVVPTYKAIAERKRQYDARQAEKRASEPETRPVKDINDPPSGPMSQPPGNFSEPH